MKIFGGKTPTKKNSTRKAFPTNSSSHKRSPRHLESTTMKADASVMGHGCSFFCARKTVDDAQSPRKTRPRMSSLSLKRNRVTPVSVEAQPVEPEVSMSQRHSITRSEVSDLSGLTGPSGVSGFTSPSGISSP